jgi:hypothetical protein
MGKTRKDRRDVEFRDNREVGRKGTGSPKRIVEEDINRYRNVPANELLHEYDPDSAMDQND